MQPKNKLTVLGSGTGVPNGERNSAGYFLETEEIRMMLDCGAGTVHALARYGVPWEQTTHLFVSHFHVDHVGEFASLMFAFRHGMKTQRSQPLELIGPQGLKDLVGALAQAFGPKLCNLSFPLVIREVSPGDTLPIGIESSVSVAKTPHNQESICATVKTDGCKLCYTGDTAYDAGLIQFFQNADLLISECSFVARREGVPHLAIADAARIAEQARVKRLLVSHFYFDVEKSNLERQIRAVFSGDLAVAHDGLTIEF
jgi:ribonuclease BN (tRNA processing enzyme)